MDDLQQRWLFALSAPMVAINTHSGAQYGRPDFYPDSEFVDLSESWDIADRPALLAMIQRMTDDGHARDLSGAYWDNARLLPGEWQALVDSLDEGQRVEPPGISPGARAQQYQAVAARGRRLAGVGDA